MQIRSAQIEEHELLSRIALEAKAYWGYRAKELVCWKADLTVSAASVGKQPTYIAEIENEIAGFFQLNYGPGDPELEHFWVRPSFMGRGIGRALLERALRHVSGRGHDELLIDADPNSEPFYIACGAERVGVKSAPIRGQPGRVRPQLVLSANAT